MHDKIAERSMKNATLVFSDPKVLGGFLHILISLALSSNKFRQFVNKATNVIPGKAGIPE
jgi:hypothetical protein